MDKIKGRHWVFIVGILLATISSIWSSETASNIIQLLFLMGIGIVITGRS